MKSLVTPFALAMMLVIGAGCGSGSNEAKPDVQTPDKNSEVSGTGQTNPTVEGTAQKITKPDGSEVVVGFSQIGSESGWRTANSQSMREEAEKRGVKLIFDDARQKQENQIKALRSFIQQRVDVIVFSPVISTGWTPILKEIQRAKIPVIVADRKLDSDPSLYVCHIGSDTVEEGRNAARWLIKKMNGKAVIAQMIGTVGSAPANDRKKGFEEVIATAPGMKIAFNQSGDFLRANGQQVMEAWLKMPDFKKVNALFAHNDDMAIGAIQAIEAAGLKPGKDIVIVSVDGVRDAFKALKAGKLNCTVECNPLLGPQVFDAVADIIAGKTLPKEIPVKEGVYDETQVKNIDPDKDRKY